MTNTSFRLTLGLAAALGLLGTSAAYGAGSAEVAVASAETASASVSLNGNGMSPVTIIAANQRETNLQKTSAYVIVSDIDRSTRHRSRR